MRVAPPVAGSKPAPTPVRLGDLRAAIGPGCRRRSTARAVRDLGRDLALYAAAIAGVLLSGSPPVQIAFGIAAGVVAAAMFVWAHDAAHGALFDGKRTNEVLGTALMLPSLQMYRLWQFGHNRVHHGFTGLTIIDWIWRPWSPAEYREASPLARFGYRIERSMLGCGWHYLRRVWWDGMVRFRGTTDRHHRDARLGRALVGAWVVVAAAATWAVGGWWAVFAAVVVPWLVFTQIIAATIYLHHTHPTRHFIDDRSQWDPVTGQVTGSVVIHASRPAAWFFHYILVHTPHHLDSRIPYYRLTEAWRDLKPAVADLDVLEYRLSLRAARTCFRECKLYDYESGRWSRFGEPAASPAPPSAVAA